MNPESSEYEARNSDEEATWQAFQYVSGELTAEEERAFESQLAADQALREAVASVVRTCGAVHVVESAPMPAPVTTAREFRGVAAAGWSVVFGALALTLVALLSVWWPSASDDAANIADGGQPVEGTAASSASPEVDEQDVLAMWYASEEELSGDQILADESLPLVDGQDDFVVPGWMFAALEPERMDGMVEEMMEEMPQPGSTNN